jgi:hypothetical protein
MKLLLAVLGLVFALLNVLVGYLFVAVALTDKMAAKGFVLQSLPLLGGVALILFALPVVWQSLALVVARQRY